MTSTTSRSGITALALAAIAAAASAQLTAYEGFDYGATAGNPGDLHLQNGGSGWAGPWDVPGSYPQTVHLASYDLDDNVLDSSGNNRHGALFGATYSTDVPTALGSGKSLSFVAANQDFVDLSQHVATYQSTHQGSISCWFKTTGTGAHTILAASDSNDGSHEIRLIVEGGRLRYDVRGDTWNAGQIVSTSTVNDGLWHHAAITVGNYATDNADLYVDGVWETTGRQPYFSSVFTMDTMGLGRNVDSGGPQWFFDGWIDDVAIYDCELTAAEVTALATGASAPLSVGVAGGPLLILEEESLATTSYPCPAYSLPPVGNRIHNAIGMLSGLGIKRELATPFDLGVDGTLYVSLLARREEGLSGPIAGIFRLQNDLGQYRGAFGWHDDGSLQAAGTGFTISGTVLPPGEVYILVMKLVASSAGSDEVYFKAYGPNDTVHGSDADLSGVMGTGPDDWTVIPSAFSSGDLVTRLTIDSQNGNGTDMWDEIRLGSTWNDVLGTVVGTAYCFGDGFGTPCPCGNNNNGSPGGCDWGDLSFPGGGLLEAAGSTSMAADDTLLIASGISNNFGIFFGANNRVNGGNGNLLNDGLRCAGGGLVRLIPPTMAAGNLASTPQSVQSLDTVAAAGVTRRYQYWFRTPSGPCGQQANLTNGFEIDWMP